MVHSVTSFLRSLGLSWPVMSSMSSLSCSDLPLVLHLHAAEHAAHMRACRLCADMPWVEAENAPWHNMKEQAVPRALSASSLPSSMSLKAPLISCVNIVRDVVMVVCTLWSNSHLARGFSS